MKLLRSVLASIYRRLVHFSQALFGDVIWQPPGWAMVLRAGAIRHPIGSIVSILGLIALLAAGCWSWNWYEHNPKPRTVSWIVNLADPSAPSDDFQPQNLTITFDQSVAKLESIGKP